MTSRATREDLLARLGPHPSEGPALQDHLRQSFGKKYLARFDATLASFERFGGSETPVFEVLWRDPSTATASFYMYATWGDAYLEHLDEFPLPEGDLLDLGCGAGVLTCLHAIERPDHQVVGVDASAKAVRCATKLAGELGLDNVRFEVGDVTAWRAGRTFDVVVSTAVRQVLGSGPFDRGPGEAFAATAATHLAAAGTYRSFERLGLEAEIEEWYEDLTSAGLAPSQAGFLTFTGFGPEKMPLFDLHHVEALAAVTA